MILYKPPYIQSEPRLYNYEVHSLFYKYSAFSLSMLTSFLTLTL